MTTTTTTCARPNCTRKQYPDVHTDFCERHYKLTTDYTPYEGKHPFPHHITQPLLDQGYSLAGICGAAGITHSHLTLLHKNNYRISGVTLRKLENLNIDNAPTQPAWRTVRRLRALLANGATYQEISEGTGISVASLRAARQGRKAHFLKATHDRMCAYYAEHEADPYRKPNPLAKSNNWTRPMQWDNIDDYDENPDAHKRVPADNVAYSIRKLRDNGMQWKDIAELLNTEISTAQKIMEKKKTIELFTHDKYLSTIHLYHQRYHTKKARAAAL